MSNLLFYIQAINIKEIRFEFYTGGPQLRPPEAKILLNFISSKTLFTFGGRFKFRFVKKIRRFLTYRISYHCIEMNLNIETYLNYEKLKKVTE